MLLQQISLFMKSVQKLSPLNDGRHLFFVIVQAQGSALLLFLVTVSLSLFSLAQRGHVHLPDWTAWCETLYVLRHSSPSHRLTTRFSLPVLKRTLFRETSFTFGNEPVHPRTFDEWYNRKPAFHHHHSPSEEEDVYTRISQTLANQPDFLKSARLFRTSKILSNQLDSLSRDSSHGTLQILAHGFLPLSHCPPQLPTA